MLRIQDITKRYDGKIAVDGISFEVARGETLALLGTSGCGKTTTLRMINRLEEPDAGEIYINDKAIKSIDLHELRRGTGYVIQNHGLFPHYTVAENISIVPHLMKWDRQKTEKAIDELMDKLNLDSSLKNQFPAQLSGGEKQRVGLARALITQPALLLMDEPFGALDSITRVAIRKELKMLPDFQEKTIIMVTHDVQEAFEMADRVCIMNAGKIMQIGKPEELLFDSSNRFINEFLKDQRLQLELKVVKIEKLKALLPSGWAPENGIGLQQSVWDVLELFSSSKIREYNGDIGQLMKVFFNYKNQAHG